MAITKIVKAPLTISGGKHLNSASPNWRIEMTFRFTTTPSKAILQENICSTGKWQVYYESGSIHTYLYYYDGSKSYSKTYSFSCGNLIANTAYTLSLKGSYSSKTITVTCNGVTNTFSNAATGWAAVSKIRNVTIGSSNMELVDQIIVAGNTGGKTGTSGQYSITIPIETATAGYKLVSGTHSEISTTYTIIALSQSISSSVTTLNATEIIDEAGGKTYSIPQWPYTLSNYDSAYSYNMTLAVPAAGISQEIINPSDTGSIVLENIEKLYTATLNKEYSATLSITTLSNGAQVGEISTVKGTIKLNEDYSRLNQIQFSWYSHEVEYESGKVFLRSAQQVEDGQDAPSYVHPKGINYKSFSITNFQQYLPTIPQNIDWNIKLSGYSSTIYKRYPNEVNGYITLDRISSTIISAAELIFTSPRTGVTKMIAKSAPELIMYQPVTWKTGQPQFELNNDNTAIIWTPEGKFAKNDLVQVHYDTYYYANTTNIEQKANSKSTTNALIGQVVVNGSAITSTNTSFDTSKTGSPYSISWSFNDELGKQLGIPDALTGQQVLIITANGIEFREDSTGVSFGGPAPQDEKKAQFYWELGTIDANGKFYSLAKRVTTEDIANLFIQGDD